MIGDIILYGSDARYLAIVSDVVIDNDNVVAICIRNDNNKSAAELPFSLVKHVIPKSKLDSRYANEFEAGNAFFPRNLSIEERNAILTASESTASRKRSCAEMYEEQENEGINPLYALR